MSNGNVTPLRPTTPSPTPESSGGGGDGGGSDRRLAAIESRLTAMETRLTVLETAFDRELKHLATKEDIQKLKVWVLGGVLGGVLGSLAIAAGLAITLLKMFAG